MEERYKELLASSLILLSEKMKRDFQSEKFREIIYEETGMDEDEFDDLLETMIELS